MIKVLALTLLPMAAYADGWTEFQNRCLTALETLLPPVVEGLTPVATGGETEEYALPEARRLVVESAPANGLSACSVIDPTGTAEVGFDAWIADMVTQDRYIEVAPGIWHSNQWIEPILALQKRYDNGVLTLRALETNLDS